jgi:PhnB protein
MANINPYLVFGDNCEEAFEFYRSVFGGEFMAKMRFSEMMPDAGDEANKIMHVALPISEGNVLMGSDNSNNMGGAPTAGNNVSIAIGTSDRGEADKLFSGLSDGGSVTMPMNDAPWGDYFGMFTDKYGFNWMINCREAK